MISITKQVMFEMGHLLPGHKGGCQNSHGHSYKIEVTVKGPQDPNNFDMIVDFKDLKEAINKAVPDHKFAYYNKDEISLELVEILNKYNLKTKEFDFITTAENMVGYFAQEIEKDLQSKYPNVYVSKVNLWETATSFATWERD